MVLKMAWHKGPLVIPMALETVLGGLAAQCEICTHIAQYPFEIVSQRGVSHPFALFSLGIAPKSLRYPFKFKGGGIAPPLRMLSKGETLRKGEGVSQPICHVETPTTP